MSYTDEDLANIRDVALRDGMHEIHLRNPNHWCTCGWATLIETRDLGAGWSGTWCNGCSLREEIKRLRSLITAWADDLDSEGYAEWSVRELELRRAVGR